MGSIKGFIDWVKGSELEDDYEDEMPRQRNEEPAMDSEPSSYNRRSYDRSYDSDAQDAPQVRRHDRSDKVVNINTTTQLAVVLVKPDRFETAAEIADHLKDKRTVVLNLEQTNKDIARRLVDFLSGVGYANEGKIKKVANSTYIITPYNVDIMGDLIDELEKRGVATLWLEVRASNAAAIALYESLGFNEATIRRNYYPTTDGREDAIIMALPISM